MALLELTPSLQHYIFVFCDADALFAVSHTCREWKAYAQQESLWFHLSRLNARRASCCTYRLCRGVAHSGADAESQAAPPAGAAEEVDPYAFMFGEAFANPVATRAVRQKCAESRSSSADVFRGVRLAEEQLHAPLSTTPADEPPHGASEARPWWPRMACPVPPPPWEASAAYESAWTSLARAGDGGHGGVREFTMRFLRYMTFSLLSTYPTALQVRGTAGNETTEEVAEDANSAGQRHSARYVDGCYYCRFVRLNDARHPHGCLRSRDGVALISPNGYTLCLAPLRDRIRTSPAASRTSPAIRPVWYTSFLRHFAIASERGWRQASPASGVSPSPYPPAAEKTRGFYVSDPHAGTRVGGWGADGSEGIVYPKELSLAFRVDWLPEAASGDAHGVSALATEDDESADEFDAATGPAECIIGFIDRQDVWRYERAAAATLEGRPSRAEDDDGLPQWLRQSADTVEAAERWTSSAPSRQGRYDDAMGGGMGYGASLFQPSAGTGVGSDDEDVEAEVASWLAATARDIEARDSRSAVPLPSAKPTTASRVYGEESWQDLGWAGARAAAPLPSSSHVSGANRAGDEPQRASSARDTTGNGGGVFVGDTPNGYGYAVCHQSWIHARHVMALALDTSAVTVDWGSADDGTSTSSAVHTTYVVFRFHTEEDCVQLSVNGENAGTVLVDAFSDGQVWVPAVSVKGARCAVTVLPPEMVHYD